MKMREIINLIESAPPSILESVVSMPYPFLYHATRASNMESIHKYGLQTRFYGAIHGEMSFHPSKPAIYLARGKDSNNLHTNMFDGNPIMILKIATSFLDPNEMYPDDALGNMVAEGETFETAGQVARAFGVPIEEGRRLLDHLDAGEADDNLIDFLKPTWRWYLKWKYGGEVSYTADIPPDAIVSTRTLAK